MIIVMVSVVKRLNYKGILFEKCQIWKLCGLFTSFKCLT